MTTARTLPGLGLKGFWALGEDGYKDEMDNNLLLLSALVQGRALSLVNATPGAPTDGDVYLFGATHPTQANKLAVRDNGAWVYLVPSAGWRFYNIATSGFYQFNGATWTADAAALTAEDVRDTIAAALVNGTNVTIVNDDAGDHITINATDTTRTDEEIQDMISTFLQQGSNVTLSYDDAGNHLTVTSSGGGTFATNYGAWTLPVTNTVYDFEDGVVPAAFTQTDALAIVTDADAGGGTKSITFAGGAVPNWTDRNFSFAVYADATHSTVTIRMKIQSFNVSSGATEGVFLYVDGVSQGFTSQTADAETAYVDHTITGLAAGAHTIRVNYHTSAYGDIGFENVYISKITAPLQSSPYKVGDVTTNGGRSWECLVTGTFQAPTIANTDWAPAREKLRELLDYDDTTAPTDGQAVVFNAASGKFKPATVASGGGGSATQISARYWGLFEVQPTVGQALVVGRAGFRLVSGGAATVPTVATGSAGAPLGAFNNTANWDTGVSSHDEFCILDFGAGFAPTEFYLTSRTDYAQGYQQMPRSLVLAYSSDMARWTQHSRYYMNFTAIGQTFSFAIPAIVTGTVGTIARPNVVQSIGVIGQTANLPAAPTPGNLLVAISTHWDNGAAIAAGWNTIYRTNGASFDGVMIMTKLVMQGDVAAQTPLSGSGSGSNLAVFEIANHNGHMVVPVNAIQEQVGTSKSLGWGAGQNTSLLIGAASTISANTAPSSIVGATLIATVQGVSGSASPRQVTTFSAPVEAGGGTVTANYAASATQYIGLAVIAPKLSIP